MSAEVVVRFTRYEAWMLSFLLQMMVPGPVIKQLQARVDSALKESKDRPL